ncbi:MAG: hypothetical protein KAR20_25590 [Candidatus Heimdallarchaeota archaeon]|nr:hypothetical protein [Candidatus Heimdallarchaeota archaeon]
MQKRNIIPGYAAKVDMHKYFFTSVLIVCFTQLISCDQRTDHHPVEIQLKALLKSQTPDKSLIIEYSDLHGLWGGLELVIKGDGSVHQKAVRIKVKQLKDLTIKEVNELVILLIENRMWQQETPDRDPNPDEAKAYLRISLGKEQSEIWEWFNDMEKNNRLIQVLTLMKELTWEVGGTTNQ